MSPSARSWARAANAGWISVADLTGSDWRVTPSRRAAPSISRKPRMPAGLAGFHSTATRVARGTTCYEQLQPLAGELHRERADPGDVAAGPCQAGNEAGRDRVADGQHDDRNGARRP